MKHLSTEELLLIADGELPANGVGHLGDCVECQSSLGELQGELTAISSALTAPASGDLGSEQSWSRLEAAISRVSQTQDLHLSPEELLLLIDGDLTPGRAEHAKRCVGCGSAFLFYNLHVPCVMGHHLHAWEDPYIRPKDQKSIVTTNVLLEVGLGKIGEN